MNFDTIYQGFVPELTQTRNTPKNPTPKTHLKHE